MCAVGLAGVVSANDIRMFQGPDRLHLPFESGYGLRFVKIPLGQHFQSHGLVQVDLPCFVDDAHAAVAEYLLKLVVAKAEAFHDATEDRFDPIAQFGEPAEILFGAQKVPRALPVLQFDLQQLAEHTVALRRRHSLGECLDARAVSRCRIVPPPMLELVTNTVEFDRDGHMRLGWMGLLRRVHIWARVNCDTY